MPRNPEWEPVKPEVLAGLERFYPYYSKGCGIDTLPKDCAFLSLMDVPVQKKVYSCSLEMIHLAMAFAGLPRLDDYEVGRAIGLTANGSDQDDILKGLKRLDLPFIGYENMPARILRRKVADRRTIFISGGQQPYAKKEEILETQAGHYTMLVCGDSTYGYSVDSGFPEGKIRVKWQYMDYLNNDIALKTGRMVYQFYAEIFRREDVRSRL